MSGTLRFNTKYLGASLTPRPIGPSLSVSTLAQTPSTTRGPSCLSQLLPMVDYTNLMRYTEMAYSSLVSQTNYSPSWATEVGRMWPTITLSGSVLWNSRSVES